MIKTLLMAVRDVFSNRIRQLIVYSFLMSFAVFMTLAGGFHLLAQEFLRFDSVFLTRLTEATGLIGIFFIALFLFPVVMPLAAGVLIDKSVERLCGKDVVLRTVPMGESLKISVSSTLRGVAASVFSASGAVIIGWIPLLNLLPLALYLYINGRVLGREYFFAVALRFSDYENALAGYEKDKARWTRAGALIAALTLVPVVNMLSPLIAVAFACRLYREGTDKQ